MRSSVKAANNTLNDELARRTHEVWQPRLGRDLGRDEAKQIAASVTGFFSILAEWSRSEIPDASDEIGGAEAPDGERAAN